ncbi:DNA repair protein RecO [Bacteroides sp. 519]|uniref:DNA repair protein RecO n=1 Tax=Bacteroides sp. 519 TaxID=2302937 RepID=UPI0013D3FE9F|nr:DNA repair protein RecO [Bacteroides sp. 519]NDV57347.1 DNA repair protein RecO [Bacteroides sp. 519]
MLQKVTGIVLHVLKYNDTSNIADIYTEQFGRASFLVSASRSKKASAKPALFQPLAFIEFEANIRPGANMYRIKEAKSVYPFYNIPYDPYKSTIALFLAEFLYRAVKEESENKPLFSYLQHSITWLDTCEAGFANFHLVFLMRLSRFLGLYPNLDDYTKGDYFDLQNACFTSLKPLIHSHYIKGEEAYRFTQLMRMNYNTMHLFAMTRTDRARCLEIINDYYQLHIPGFGELKSLGVLQALFD